MAGDKWDKIWALARRVDEQGEPLALTEDVLILLRQSAREVAFDADEAEQALHDVPSATALLREIGRRIGEGSRRLSRALNRMYRFRDEGDIEGACRQMEEVLDVEVVPFYRKIAEGELRKLRLLNR